MDVKNTAPGEAEELVFEELVRTLWTGRVFITCATILGVLIAGGLAFIVPKTYEAAIVISPVPASSSSGGMSGLSALGSQIGGLAALAGVSVGSDTKKSESIAVLQSAELTEEYIERNNLLPLLYRKKWDATHKAWKVGEFSDLPTLWKANEFFKKYVRTIATDSKTGILTLTISWEDAKLAADWANGLVKLANSHLKDNAISESERNIQYLRDEAAKSSVVEARSAIYSVMESEINKEMLARGTDEYAFKVLDPATPPEKPASPKRVVWALIGMVLSSVFSSLWVLVRTAWWGRRRASRE